MIPERTSSLKFHSGFSQQFPLVRLSFLQHVFFFFEKKKSLPPLIDFISAVKPGFKIKIVNTSGIPIAASDVICQAFKDAGATFFFGVPFGGKSEEKLAETPQPLKIGAIICSDINGVLAQIKRTQKSRGIIGVRSPSPPAPEDVDGIQLNFDSEDDIPIDDIQTDDIPSDDISSDDIPIDDSILP